MAGKKLLRGIFGRSSDCKKDDKNQRQRQSTSMVQRPVEHQAVSNTFSLHSAAARPEDTCHGRHDTRNEQNNTFQQCIHEGDQEDIDMAASVFIDRFRRDLEMQRALSNARYYGYLERAT